MQSGAGKHQTGLRLEGRVALVTGGSRGIGRAIVERLAQAGVMVVVNFVNDRDAAETTVSLVRAKGGNAIPARADIASLPEAERLIALTVEQYQRLDILVCNSGVWQGGPVEEISEALWDKTMDVNLRGTWTVCRAAVPIMKNQRFGRIVIVSSTAGQRGEPYYSNYAASKGGQIAFTKALSAELAAHGINVNAVAPGWVETDMTRAVLADQAQRRAIELSTPLGRIATADDIAGPVVFLCSEWARHITGEILNVNGGSVLCG